MAEYSPEFVKTTVDSFFDKCARHRRIGGIALADVVDGKKEIPEGWSLDSDTMYYLPEFVNRREEAGSTLEPDVEQGVI